MTVNAAERSRNPFLQSSTGGRVLSAIMLPHFTLFPPRGFGVLTTTGRRTGKTRRKCIRAIRRGNRVYIVAIRQSAWQRNVESDPSVRLRIRGGTFAGVARPLRADEQAEAAAAYCESVHAFDYAECTMWRRGIPRRAKITELHRQWFERGTPLVVEIGPDSLRRESGVAAASVPQ